MRYFLSLRYVQNSTCDIFTSHVQGVSEPIEHTIAEVGIGVVMKPQFTLSSIFRKPKDLIDFEEKRGLVDQISRRDCDAVYIGETGGSGKPEKGNMLV